MKIFSSASNDLMVLNNEREWIGKEVAIISFKSISRYISRKSKDNKGKTS
jgi:hypothetical protein